MHDEERQWIRTDLAAPTERTPINFLDSERQKQARRARSRRRFFVAFFLFVAVSIAGITSARIFSGNPPTDIAAYDPVTLEPKKPEGFLRRLQHLVFQKEVVLEGERDDRINMLLLGMGGPGHDGPFLTDTIIIASIQPSTGKVAMISIPRDLGVEMTGKGWYKINHANAFGEERRSNWGAAYAAEVVEKNFAIDIHYYVRLDFKAFEEIIDEVGGVKVNVERAFVDAEYPAPNDAYQTVQFAKGVETMNGKRALIYARSRHGNNGEGGDFARARRQQKMLLALKEKVVSFSTLANPVRIKNIVDSLDQHITTNMSFTDMIALVKMGRTLDTDSILTIVFDNSSGGYLRSTTHPTAGYLLTPVTGNFGAMRTAIEQVFENGPATPDDTPAQDAPAYAAINIELQNATWQAGLAARMKKRLSDRKFTVTTVGNADMRPLPTSGIYVVSSGADDTVVSALSEELGIPVSRMLPAGLRSADTTDILVVLGEDLSEE